MGLKSLTQDREIDIDIDIFRPPPSAVHANHDIKLTTSFSNREPSVQAKAFLFNSADEAAGNALNANQLRKLPSGGVSSFDRRGGCGVSIGHGVIRGLLACWSRPTLMEAFLVEALEEVHPDRRMHRKRLWRNGGCWRTLRRRPIQFCLPGRRCCTRSVRLQQAKKALEKKKKIRAWPLHRIFNPLPPHQLPQGAQFAAEVQQRAPLRPHFRLPQPLSKIGSTRSKDATAPTFAWLTAVTQYAGG